MHALVEMHARVEMHALVEHYAGDAARDPDAFPGHGDPAGLPPVLVLDCELDTLRFSAEVWARAIAEAGGHVVVEQYAGPRTPGHARRARPADVGARPRHARPQSRLAPRPHPTPS